MEELVIGEKTYVSSKRASEITGYAKDYIGQLCREGRVQATLVGRSWYVLESSIREHRFGAEEVAKEPEIEPVAPGIGLTWTPPVYTKEEPVPAAAQSVGVNALEPIVEEEIPLETVEETIEVVHDKEEEPATVLENMQNAWQDWFKTRGERKEGEESVYGSEAQNYSTDAVVENAVVDTGEEEEEPVEQESVPVSISMIEEPEEVEEIEEAVPVVRFYKHAEPVEEDAYIDAAADTIQVRDYRRKPSYVASSLMLVVAGVAVLIAVIGSGSLNFIAKDGGIQAGTIYYFSGTKVIK